MLTTGVEEAEARGRRVVAREAVVAPEACRGSGGGALASRDSVPVSLWLGKALERR